MMAVNNAPAQIDIEQVKGVARRKCPECAARLSAGHPRQIFCCDAHRRAWHAREQLRGRQLYRFAVVARVTRAGTRGDQVTGRRAHADADLLIQRWRDEDKAANRASATVYLAELYRLGFDRP